jgi:hypothetical protein
MNEYQLRAAANISYPASSVAVVFGWRLSARFPCPAGQEIARNPPLRVASYVSGHYKCDTAMHLFKEKDN